jgi:hypothetical protein
VGIHPGHPQRHPGFSWTGVLPACLPAT